MAEAIRKWCRRNIYTIVTICLISGFGYYVVIGSYGFSLLPDEFGYWAPAARIAGYDWSAITSMNSYYSYGYSILLFPIFCICKNGIWAYRLALILNFLMLIAIFFVLKKMAKQAFKNISDNAAIVFAAVTVTYPSLLFYSRTTMAEVLLATMYAVICLLMYNYIRNGGMWRLIFLSVANIYIYFVHMRSVGIVISTVLILALYLCFADKKNRKNFLIFLGMILLALAVGYMAKNWVTQNIYATADEETLKGNDYAGQMWKLKYIFTLEGFKNLIISIAGKTLYVGAASFGLAYWGLAYSLRIILKKTIDLKQRFWYGYVLTSSVAEILISSIATLSPWRVDTLLYGRYHDFVVPVLMFIGIYAIWTSRKTIAGTIFIIISEAPMVMLLIYSLVINKQTVFKGFMIPGMCYVYNESTFEPIKYYCQAYLLAIFLTLLVMTFIICARKRKKLFILLLVTAVELVLTVRAYAVGLDSTALGIFRDMRDAERVEELCQEKERRIIYINSNDNASVAIMQFMLRDRVIDVYKRTGDDVLEKIKDDDIVLLNYKDTYIDKMYDIYNHVFVYGHFALCYNEL